MYCVIVQATSEKARTTAIPGLYNIRISAAEPCSRPLKKVLFDTTGFLGAQNLTQEQRDSRQNLYDNRSKEQCFEAICEHITAV